jgi:pimeloyl-ACP methyl ester carboxylesterase
MARPAYITKRGFPTYPNLLEGFPSVACSDSDNPDTYDAWSAAGAAADTANGYFGRLWTWITSPCAEWPNSDSDRYMGPFDHETDNPVLVIGNLFDPATPYHGAQIVADLLPNSALLTVHGWGHTSLFMSQCADAAVAAYLIDVTTPAPGTVCEQDVIPFAGP